MITDRPSLNSLVLGILDAFPAHIAVLDRDGVIRAVNGKWRNFANANGGTDACCGVGTNYLEVTRRAAAAGVPGADAIAGAIERLFAGDPRPFELEYPCHSPTEQRWFNVHLSAFSADGEACVLVKHDDATPHALSREAINKLALVARRTSNGVLITDTRLRVEWVNDAFTAMTGYGIEELRGHDLAWRLFGPSTQGLARDELRAAFAARRSTALTTLNYHRDGRPIWLEMRIDPVYGEDGALSHFVALTSDVSEQRRLAQQAAEAAQRERERIALDLHDGLGQELAGAMMMLSAGLRRLGKDHPDAPLLVQSIEALQRATASAREIAQGMAPVQLSRGLLPALEGMAAQLTVPGTLAVAVSANQGIIVDGTHAEQLYRIAQEAVSNCVRHSHAHFVSMSLQHSPERLEMRIVDDGIGFDPQHADEGLGLRVMRYRATSIGGQVRIERAGRGRGTVVCCTLPLQPPSRATAAVAPPPVSAPAPVQTMPIR